MTIPSQITAMTAALEKPGAATSDFDLNPSFKMSKEWALRDAAVLIPVMVSPEGEHLILTKRSSALKHHPGQIAFPGGKRDGEETLCETALREAEEEIGLNRAQVKIVGSLPSHKTATGFLIAPKVAIVEGPFHPTPEPGEVAEVFYVPLAHVLNPKNYVIEGRYWRGQKRLYYIVPYGPYYIWGATACILRSLALRVSS